MAYASINTAVPFYTLAKQGSLYDISGILDSCAPVLKAAIDDAGWAAASTTEGIFGVPTTARNTNGWPTMWGWCLRSSFRLRTTRLSAMRPKNGAAT